MPADPTKPRPNVSLKKTALPTEHGSWGFLFEPIVAGLAVAFSVGGLFIALMTIGGFLMRQPLKTYVIDRQGMRVPERAQAAMRFIALSGVVALTGLIGALWFAGWHALVPFMFAAPLAIYQIYSDTQRRSRGLRPELSGSVTMSASIAAIVLAAGGPWEVAGALWAVLFARLFSSVLYVRERLLLEKGKPYTRLPATLSHISALILVVGLSMMRWVPLLTIVAFLILLGRAVTGLSPNRKPMKAMQIGVREVIFGAIMVVSIIAGYYTGI